MLIDGGRVQLPGRAAYDPSGTGWGIENVGVAPDHDVEITPADVIEGRDPQLHRFNVQPAGGELRFERDAAGRISGIAVTLPNGQEVKARRSQ